MLLKDLIKDLDIISSYGDLNKKIKKITYDSRQCVQDTLFIAIEGYEMDGHDYILSAIENGATAIVHEKNIIAKKSSVTYFQVKDSRLSQSILSNHFFNYPSRKLNMIGITGTNGKTSVSFLTAEIIRHWKKTVGSMGTIGNYIGNKLHNATHTTPEIIETQEMLSQMIDLKIDYNIMEVSSHSLSLNRVKGLDFDIGIFTNLSQDHLDFHKTIENYFAAKAKLFYMTKKANIINGDDPYGQRILKKIKAKKIPTYSFGINNTCDFMAKNINIDNKGVNFIFEGKGIKERISVSIPGIFSVYNTMVALIVGYIEKIPVSIMKEALENITFIPGRFEVVDIEQPYTVIIDYAHTPDALENVLNTIKSFSKGHIITMFGCGGDRDKGKRPIMGEIAGNLSDFCIVTSDNPRSEDPISIIEDIIPGIKKTECEYQIVENRREAMKTALAMAKKDDIILIAGKGHETYQILKNETIVFDERKIIKELLREDE